MGDKLKSFIEEAYCSDGLTGESSVLNPHNYDLSRFFIQEIAGRDSIAALNTFLEGGTDFKGVILSVAFAPVEFGDPSRLYENIKVAEKIAEEHSLKVAYAASRDTHTWRELAGKNAFAVSRKYGFYTPCIACHAYLHLLRAYIALDTHCHTIISGERIFHENRVKINQDAASLSFFREIFSEYGIDFITPVEHVSTEEDIASLLPFDWKEGELQMKCLFSGNSTIEDTSVIGKLNQAKARYLHEFLGPEMKRLLSSYSQR